MADNDGFSLHADVRCGADERLALEQLCRHTTRPALAKEWVKTFAAGQMVLEHETAWCDSTKHLAMSPLEFKGLPIQGRFVKGSSAGAASAMGRWPPTVQYAPKPAIGLHPALALDGISSPA